MTEGGVESGRASCFFRKMSNVQTLSIHSVFLKPMKTNGPWKIKDSQVKYKNPWISVREDQVIRPDGKDGIFGVVEMVAGVSVLPLDDEGFVYLTKEFHYAIEQDSVEVISGAIDEDETELEAAKRELKEELGIEADEWIDLGKLNPFTTVVKSPATMYLARGIKLLEANPEGTEKIDLVKVTFDDAVRMVMESKITHGQSCVLILKASEYLRRRM
ncbi:TPA: DNA mismatch repair protein MutT [Candidatus Uhrbacteria bacterium]|uniref:Pyrophosphohydrolase related protein n=2 Tax=Candidatus Uhriibacteriota TaxID=1752732 RepID=A0A0G1SGU2_9BACT|nr:MAG: Pyrophosphohydrolase related protein [Candidatus Uhrbacteria bacterium GW2011_GWF2_46_218]KKU41323.1 MAG: Pyrophosphohydrolase related protein [Candidatus Uhrbacteria bacterium GW2011_GWE2_46_68]HBK33760.1 DNA mismatch repair protein MutT [Candidatus Uhrbacteria bacterium]HCB19399.1 DNA mismatch repair protein MutT [Candidatus Uhrbacteria bacterium]